MSYSTGHKRKLQAEVRSSEQPNDGFVHKRIRTSERSGDVTEDSGDSDIDEYLPETARVAKPGRSALGHRGKKDTKVAHKSRSTKTSKMSVDDHRTNNDDTPVPMPGAVLKNAHGRPLSREQIRKANHSLIERRRREKMNKAFADLRSMVPGLSGESEGIKGEFKLEVSLLSRQNVTRGLSNMNCATGIGEIGRTHEISRSTSHGNGKHAVDILNLAQC